MLGRIGDWIRFSKQQVKHLEQYVIPQYQMRNGTGIESAEACVRTIKKYANRFGKGQRDNKEALRDMLKIAHIGQVAYDRLKKELLELVDLAQSNKS